MNGNEGSARVAYIANPLTSRSRFSSTCERSCTPSSQVEETLKWGSPAFMHEGILAGMAAFKSQRLDSGRVPLSTHPAARRSRNPPWAVRPITALSDLPGTR